jgi:hypothetical protein
MVKRINLPVIFFEQFRYNPSVLCSNNSESTQFLNSTLSAIVYAVFNAFLLNKRRH